MKRLFVSSGITYPEALKTLFDRICEDHQIKTDGPEALGLARTIVSLFQAGVCDEAGIRAVLDSMEDGTLARPPASRSE